MPTDEPSSSPRPSPSRPLRAGACAPYGAACAATGSTRRHDGPAPAATPGSGVDIVDQAEVFKTLKVADVMTPRARHHGHRHSRPPSTRVVRQFAEVEHSRMPVYRDSLDDPVGVVHIKDVFKLLATEGGAPAARDPVLHRLRREVLYVPASMRGPTCWCG